MKYSFVSALALAASVNAHAIMQRIKVDGTDQGSLVGLRAPSTNNPVQDVTSDDLICGADDSSATKVIEIAAGSSVAAGWAHVLGGPQGSSDSDNPIASSHKGPTQVYLAKVDDAATAAKTDLKWFKIASDGVTSDGTWGVDDMIANVDSDGFGWQKFTMPECIAAGQYLMKVELLALHSASSEGGAQFYGSCAQIKVTGSGSYSGATADEISFPGGYTADDAGILANIYDTSIYSTYKAPGPDVITCGASSGSSSSGSSSAAASAVSSTAAKVVSTAAASSAAPATTSTTQAATSATAVSSKVAVSSAAAVTSAAAAVTTKATSQATTLATVVKSSSAAAQASTASTVSTNAKVTQWERCGGQGWTGNTECADGLKCQVQNDFYSQCVAA